MYEKRILKLQKMIAEIKQNFVMLVTKDTEDEQRSWLQG